MTAPVPPEGGSGDPETATLASQNPASPPRLAPARDSTHWQAVDSFRLHSDSIVAGSCDREDHILQPAPIESTPWPPYRSRPPRSVRHGPEPDSKGRRAFFKRRRHAEPTLYCQKTRLRQSGGLRRRGSRSEERRVGKEC